ncbi:hypothetical protein BJX70DRAFT_390534 [Aspergillus crustosus]
MPTCKPYDDVAWAISTQVWKDWPELLRTDGDIYNDIGIILTEQFSDLEWEIFEFLSTGGFNVCFKMGFTNNFGAVIRFPVPGAVMLPEEKVRNEVSAMQFILEKTSDKIPIPVPTVFRSVETKESPSELGPFIIMSYIPHKGSMGDLLETPGRQAGESPVFNPGLELVRLESLYRELAKISFSLATLSFSRIGSLHKNNNSIWEPSCRPLSYSMNEIVQLGTLPRSELPTTTYDKASSYFEALAELHISHLKSQRNEADIEEDIDNDVLADDFRRKFVARFLFRKLVQDPKQRQQWILHDNGPFPVWCDDLRPENVLVDETEKVIGVVDWEFTYTAPVEFAYAPPWWLLLKKPEDWPGGLDEWCAAYEKPLRTFLEAMRKCENEVIQKKQLLESQRLSSQMRNSWQSGNFWIMYAARHNFAFDAIYWKKIDQRLHLLEPGEKKLMEEYVTLKLKERNIGHLTWDADEYTVGWIQRMKETRWKEMDREENERVERERMEMCAEL